MVGVLLAALEIAGLDPQQASPDKEGRRDEIVPVPQPHKFMTLNISKINGLEIHMLEKVKIEIRILLYVILCGVFAVLIFFLCLPFQGFANFLVELQIMEDGKKGNQGKNSVELTDDNEGTGNSTKLLWPSISFISGHAHTT